MVESMGLSEVVGPGKLVWSSYSERPMLETSVPAVLGAASSRIDKTPRP